MALSETPTRREIHSRTLEIKSYEREDGLFDIEGHLTDIGPPETGEPGPWSIVHEMWLRLSVDTSLTVRESQAWTVVGPYGECPQVNARYADLAGLNMGPGWNRKVRERVGGVCGCTHLSEMTGQMATAAYQALWPHMGPGADRTRPDGTPAIINTCHAYRRDGAAVKIHFPEHYTGAD